MLSEQGRIATAERCVRLALELATLKPHGGHLFRARMEYFYNLAEVGQWTAADAMWHMLDPMSRDGSRAIYRPGDAERYYAQSRFWQEDMREEDLTRAEQLARSGRSRNSIRALHRLRGEWRLQQGHWALAADSFHEAVRMAREVGGTDATSEARLALAKLHLGTLDDPRREAEQIVWAGEGDQRALADLWLAAGDHERARKHALAAYTWAWADGEPYVRRYELNKTRALLERLGTPIPDLPPYDPAKDEKLPWEDEVAEAIEKLRVEQKASAREVP
jgi:hypothetical protein